jgi:hypothetical protein
VAKPEADQIQMVAQNKSFTGQNQALTHSQVLKHRHHRDRPLLAGNPKILTNPDPKQNFLLPQELEPFLVHKLPVSHQTSNTGLAKDGDELFHNSDAFSRVGVAFFRQKGPVDRKGHPVMDNRQHQQVD